MTKMAPLRILLWHVHGSWSEAFVRGGHRYYLPTLDEGGPWGRGLSGRDWPAAEEVPVDRLKDLDVDVVVLQRPDELALAARWLRRRPGIDVPAVYVEHNTPRPHAVTTRHPLADRDDIPLVHVTHFNELMWDSGIAPTVVVPHGIPDPGERYTGELPHGAAMINEPVRRDRITGTDLLPTFAEIAPVDVFGIGSGELEGKHPGVRPGGDLPSRELHTEAAKRRVYLHTARWTSLGLSLLEAMHLGMPVVALATTEATLAVPPDAGAISTDVQVLTKAYRELVHEPDFAVLAGKAAREHALAHYGLDAFLKRWDALLTEVTA
ncbi:glycosyltransferase [Amycolatopsis regifaucium]|uniref:Glycosyl transferase n=1 Tax=Amycolatopsis regifaucium TaxID=546365 RepID=A0A154M3Y0_9PSEU|nr:glycosyltransferase [Amycolatopsis regifaucium]KZB79325.1 glycosyl transferase [Amycolatopsis regifaucium]OKA07508.1 glycosyl transferase [Amycolatopsis regifaucium]SFH09748.1 Glycosyl transferases group 1 [Amycolatopsis regifaucium]